MADFGWKNGLVNTGQSSNAAVSTSIARNPWGRSATDTTNKSRNLHRTDLWYVDFSTAYTSVQNQFSSTSKIDPIYCKSVSLPETRVKPEVFKRDGIPFNMPSWDDPLDPVALLMHMESVTPNPVLRFFSDWLTLVRAGRGERYTDGYDSSTNELTLGDGSNGGVPYGIEISFPFKVWLLQGSNSTSARSAYCQLEKVTGFEIKGWLGSMKVADLTYEGSQILTCEVKIFPEYVVQTAS